MPLDRALEALADRDPRDLHRLPGREGFDGDGLADLKLALTAKLDEMPVCRGTRLLEMAELRLRELPLRDGVERDLNRLVAVDLHRLHLDHGARAGLDHGDRRHRAALRIEDLRHAELPSQDSLHQRSPPEQMVRVPDARQATVIV